MILSDYDEKLETQKTISFRHDFQIANEYTLYTTTNKIKASQNPWMESKFLSGQRSDSIYHAIT